MQHALDSVDRTILYSLCDWGNADVNEWGKNVGSAWRTTEDIRGMCDIAIYRTVTDAHRHLGVDHRHHQPEQLLDELR